MATVAFIGLGVMGYPMAGHLRVKGGHEVTVYNRTGAKAQAWVAQFGGRVAASPREAALGLLVCSGAACPAGSPFPAFLGTQRKGAGQPVALVTELVLGAELASVWPENPKPLM